MKNTIKLILLFLLAVGIYAGFSNASADNVGGSINDPLVTKSYVDEKLASIEELRLKLEKKLGGSSDSSSNSSSGDDIKSAEYKKLEERIAALEKANKEGGGNKTENTSTSTTPEGFKHSDKFVVIVAGQGDKLLLGEGAEFVLRFGEGLIIAGEKGGIADLTAGKDLGDEAQVPMQHLLLSSRNDGRGIFLTLNGNNYMLVKGDYKLQ